MSRIEPGAAGCKARNLYIMLCAPPPPCLISFKSSQLFIELVSGSQDTVTTANISPSLNGLLWPHSSNDSNSYENYNSYKSHNSCNSFNNSNNSHTTTNNEHRLKWKCLMWLAIGSWSTRNVLESWNRLEAEKTCRVFFAKVIQEEKGRWRKLRGQLKKDKVRTGRCKFCCWLCNLYK